MANIEGVRCKDIQTASADVYVPASVSVFYKDFARFVRGITFQYSAEIQIDFVRDFISFVIFPQNFVIVRRSALQQGGDFFFRGRGKVSNGVIGIKLP